MNPCPAQDCHTVLALATLLVAMALVTWFPYAVRESPVPKLVKWLALTLVVLATLVSAFWVPYACPPCGAVP